jgi:hypothetical protein
MLSNLEKIIVYTDAIIIYMSITKNEIRKKRD